MIETIKKNVLTPLTDSIVSPLADTFNVSAYTDTKKWIEHYTRGTVTLTRAQYDALPKPDFHDAVVIKGVTEKPGNHSPFMCGKPGFPRAQDTVLKALDKYDIAYDADEIRKKSNLPVPQV
jgi:hypothetical protein